MQDKKPRLIILEGINRIGKSSIIKTVETANGDGGNAKLVRMRKTESLPHPFYAGMAFTRFADKFYSQKQHEYNAMQLSAYVQMVKSGLINPDFTIFADRLHLSDYVYGCILASEACELYENNEDFIRIQQQKLLAFENYIQWHFNVHMFCIIGADQFGYYDFARKDGEKYTEADHRSMSSLFKHSYSLSRIRQKNLNEFSNVADCVSTISNSIIEIIEHDR